MTVSSVSPERAGDAPGRSDRPPSVDALARSLADTGLPHPLLVDAARAAIAAGDPERARSEAEAIAAALLRPVVNATGVLLHTNLGRAPVAHTQPAASTNLELDLTTGERGSRSAHAARLRCLPAVEPRELVREGPFDLVLGELLPAIGDAATRQELDGLVGHLGPGGSGLLVARTSQWRGLTRMPPPLLRVLPMGTREDVTLLALR